MCVFTCVCIDLANLRQSDWRRHSSAQRAWEVYMYAYIHSFIVSNICNYSKKNTHILIYILFDTYMHASISSASRLLASTSGIRWTARPLPGHTAAVSSPQTCVALTCRLQTMTLCSSYADRRLWSSLHASLHSERLAIKKDSGSRSRRFW